MASPARQILARLEAMETPRQPPALPDEILIEILLCVATPADLACASMACRSFHRFIAEPYFLRRYRALHPPLLLGILDGEFKATEEPYPTAPAGRAFAHAADFDFEGYVPRNGWHGWGTCDIRDGRVLLKYGPWMKKEGFDGFPDLAVCDPLSRRYLLLPPIPDGLLAPIQVHERNVKLLNAYIVPSGAGEDEMTFRVMGVALWLEKLVMLIFSSSTRSWSIASSTTWEALSLTVPQNGLVLEYGRGYFSYDCYYRKVDQKNKLLRFNTRTAEFSTLDLPPNHEKMPIFIVEAGGGRLGMFSQISSQVIRYSIWQNGAQRSRQWKMVNIVPLPADYSSIIVGAFGRYIFISGYPKRAGMQTPCFTLETKTLKIRRIGRMMGYLHCIHPFFGYPPFLSPRLI